MKLRNIFILLFGAILITLSLYSTVEAKELEVDTSMDATLASINQILERNEQYENLDSIIRNLEYNENSYTLNVFCKENNDKELITDCINRLARVHKIITSHKINFLNHDFNLL